MTWAWFSWWTKPLCALCGGYLNHGNVNTTCGKCYSKWREAGGKRWDEEDDSEKGLPEEAVAPKRKKSKRSG